ncbi:MAG: TetR/AcrR family transcriptional regulator [Acidimicrobiales bacterium]
MTTTAAKARPRQPAPSGPGRLRADARRNRQRVIEAATEAFRTEGLSVPVREIARRAGVGTGTVSRHFPTKEALFGAVLVSRVDRIVEIGEALAREGDPGQAFFVFFAELVAEATAHLGLAEALAGAGFDLGAIKRGGMQTIMGLLGELMVSAQAAGTVRADADVADVEALICGCLARDASARDRMVSIARAGLHVDRQRGPTRARDQSATV